MLEKHVASELASDKTLNRMEKKASGMEVLKVRTILTALHNTSFIDALLAFRVLRCAVSSSLISKTRCSLVSFPR